MNLGLTEMIFLFVLGLLLFGPKKLPEIGRQLGKALAQFKRASNEFQAQLNEEVRKLEIENPLDAPTQPSNTAARGNLITLDPASGGHEGETPESSSTSTHAPERQNG